MMRHPRTAVAALLGAVALAGCNAARGTLDAAQVASSDTCTRCHGSSGNPAPPRSLLGETDPSAIGVGAHQAHLGGGTLRTGIACGECHVVPATVDAPGHMVNAHASVKFGPLATTGGAQPTWNRDQATCASTYCHGATLSGGTNTSPIWTRGSSQATCGSCHGLPPGGSHPAVTGGLTACAGCHPGTVKPDGTLDLAGGLHMNGVPDVGGMACTTCHGDATRASNGAAPPKDTKGNTSTSALGVGAHQTHLNAGPLRGALACSDCHTVPTSIPHATGTVDMTFGALARTGNLTPAFNATTASCSSVYCHGATLPGGTNTAPTWTKVDGTQAACGTCHGIPPPAPHVQSTACGSCHTGYTSTSVNVATHIDGQVQANGGTCTSCHGDPTRAVNGAAPPKDTKGNTSTSALGVGAHQAHLNAGPLRGALACSDCHTVPTSIPHATGTVDMTFGALARTGSLTPAFNATTATCSSVYCHGATLPGGTNKAPTWTKVDGTQAACGTCHGAPPSSGHHGNHSGRACSDCHTGTYTLTSADPSIHINGKIEIGNRITSWNPSTRTCVGCHGQQTW
jgi:predicted CxxxxCH...CXXCH cytochrome family protein